MFLVLNSRTISGGGVSECPIYHGLNYLTNTSLINRFKSAFTRTPVHPQSHPTSQNSSIASTKTS